MTKSTKKMIEPKKETLLRRMLSIVGALVVCFVIFNFMFNHKILGWTILEENKYKIDKEFLEWDDQNVYVKKIIDDKTSDLRSFPRSTIIIEDINNDDDAEVIENTCEANKITRIVSHSLSPNCEKHNIIKIDRDNIKSRRRYSEEEREAALSIEEFNAKISTMTDYQKDNIDHLLLLDEGVVKNVHRSTTLEQKDAIVEIHYKLNIVNLYMEQEYALEINKGQNIKFLGTLKNISKVRNLVQVNLLNIQLLD